MGRTRILQGFEITHIKLLVTRAIAANQPDVVTIDYAMQWEFWGRPPANTPPVAMAGSDQSLVGAGSYPVDVHLNALASYDPDGDPIRYSWNAIPGAWDGDSGSTPTVSLLPGTYDIVLTVTDDRFGSASDTVRIVISDAFANLNGTVGPQGPEGPPGPTGPDGRVGPQGPPGAGATLRAVVALQAGAPIPPG